MTIELSEAASRSYGMDIADSLLDVGVSLWR